MDLFLEYQVRDLVATAKQQAQAGSFEAAGSSYRTALAAVESALSLDPSNQSALRLRQELAEALSKLPPVSTPEATVRTAPDHQAVPAPSFRLIKEGDLPLIEESVEMLGPDHGGYLPDPEFLSIMDAHRRPEKPDYLRIAAAVATVALLAVAVRVVSYFGTSHFALDTTPLEQKAQYHLVASPPVPAAVNPDLVDDTLYYPDAGVTLPLLQSKSQAKGNSQGKVVLLAVIGPNGSPVNARVLRTEDPGLNVSALEAASQWRFRPGTKDGKPVPVLAQLEVTFRP
jgi:TonB family protein